jgi:hypothetical protein
MWCRRRRGLAYSLLINLVNIDPNLRIKPLPGGDNMIAKDKLDYDKVIEVAQNMGYNPKKPKELQKYINKISKMDLWDISKILFFGEQYARY